MNHETRVGQQQRQQPLRDHVAAMVFVRSSHLCQGLSDEELETLFESGSVDVHGAGEAVLVEGQNASGLLMLLDGLVNLGITVQEHTVDLGVVERPTILGVRSSLTDQPSKVGAIAHSDVQLVRFPPAVVRQVADSNQRFGRLLAALMAARSKETEKRIAAALSHGATGAAKAC